jgi:hypothetical protein
MTERQDAGEAGNTEAESKAPEPVAAPPPGFDLDAKELEAARLEAAKETAGDEAPKAEPTTGEAAEAAAPAEPPAKPTPPKPGPVPYERFAEMTARARRTAEEAAYLRGKLEALETRLNQQQQPQNESAAATPLQPMDEVQMIRASIREQAKRADRGEITFEELEAFRAEAEAKIDAIREARLAAPRPGLADSVFEEQHLNMLYERHPYARALTPAQVENLTRIAYIEAASEGRPYGEGPTETIRLREHIARLSDTYGPRWNVPASKPSAQQSPNKAGKPTMTPTAAARVAKMDMADRLPPDVALTGPGGAANDLTEDRLLAMSDEEVAALPAATKERIMARR